MTNPEIAAIQAANPIDRKRLVDQYFIDHPNLLVELVTDVEVPGDVPTTIHGGTASETGEL